MAVPTETSKEAKPQHTWGEELRAENEQRLFIYRMIAELLGGKPGPHMVRALRAPGVACNFEQCNFDLGLASMPDGEAEAADWLAAEYTWLFVGPMNHIQPFASLHRPEEQGTEIWGKSTQKVRQLLKGLGLEPKLKGMVPDHLVVEFDLMAHLLKAEIDLLGKGDGEQAARCRDTERMFLDEHLLAWFPFFSAKVSKRARIPIYRELCRFAVEFLIRDREGLGQPCSKAWTS